MATASKKRKRCENCGAEEDKIHELNVTQMNMELEISKMLELMNQRNDEIRDSLEKQIAEMDKMDDAVYRKSKNFQMTPELQNAQTRVQNIMVVVNMIKRYVDQCCKRKLFNDETYTIEPDEAYERYRHWKNLNKRKAVRSYKKRSKIYVNAASKYFPKLIALVEKMEPLLIQMVTQVNEHSDVNALAIDDLVQRVTAMDDEIVQATYHGDLPGDNWEVKEVVRASSRIVLSLSTLRNYKDICVPIALPSYIEEASLLNVPAL